MSGISDTAPVRVLFLCTHNSSRSQMAEGLLRARGGDRYAVFSAGTHPRSVHPLAIQRCVRLALTSAMLRATAGYRAKSLDEFKGQPPMGLVVTVYDDAAEECPYFRGARRQEHWGFPDPSAVTGGEEERLTAFRSVRDAISRRIDDSLQSHE